MKILFLVTAIGFIILGCNNQKPIIKHKSFEAFDFSYNDVFSTCFSIKFTQSDTIFIRQHFAGALSDTPKSKTSYYALLSNDNRAILDSFIIHASFPIMDTLYYEPYQDGIDYQFYFQNDTIKKLIHVHRESVPLSLKAFGNWILNTKNSLLLHQIDTTLYFGSTKGFLPPTVPAPPMKFTTPWVK